jgi:hypothetical protein
MLYYIVYYVDFVFNKLRLSLKLAKISRGVQFHSSPSVMIFRFRISLRLRQRILLMYLLTYSMEQSPS